MTYEVLEYVQHRQVATIRHRAIISMAVARSPKWSEFIATNPKLKAGWYNRLVNWLLENFPDEFVLKEPNP